MDEAQRIAYLAGEVLGREVPAGEVPAGEVPGGEVPGGQVVGAYLYGSSVLGGLKPASDLDVLVVSRRPMAGVERQALLGALLRTSPCGAQARPVEVTVVVQDAVRPWRYPPVCDFQYGEWLRGEFEAGLVPQPEPMPDLALLVSMVLSAAHPLTGPPPSQVLEPVPHEDLLRACVAGIPVLLGDLYDDTRNVLLTLARIWHTVATGGIAAKDAAADWALRRLPAEHRPAMEHARDLYLGCRYAEETWSDELRARVRPLADAVLAEVTRLTGG